MLIIGRRVVLCTHVHRVRPQPQLPSRHPPPPKPPPGRKDCQTHPRQSLLLARRSDRLPPPCSQRRISRRPLPRFPDSPLPSSRPRRCRSRHPTPPPSPTHPPSSPL